MKKIHTFAVFALVLISATSVSFAQTANTVQQMTGIRGVSLRTYCTFSTIFRANNVKCFDANKVASINTASIGAIDLGTGTGSLVIQTPPNTTLQTATIEGFNVPIAPQIIERTVIVQGTPGLQGPAGRDGQSSFGSVTNIPQVFWAGGGGSSAPSVTTILSGTALPIGGLPGQVLTLDASSTPVWYFSAMSTTSNATTSALAWLLGGNSAVGTSSFIGTIDPEDLVIRTNNVERARIAANGNLTLFTNDQNASSSMTVKGIHSDGRWGIFDEANNKLIQNRADQGILGFGTGDFVSYGFNSAMGIRGADVHIPHLVVGGNHIGPNNISQLRMESSSQTEYQYAGAYPNRVNSYILSTTLSAPLATTDIRANMKIGARDLQFFTGANNLGTPAFMVAENGNIGIGTTTPMRPLTVVGNVGGTLGLFQNTRPGAPAGVSFMATRADSAPANRFGWFVNPNVSGEDRLAVHASGIGDLWSFSKNGDLVGSLGTSFDQRNDATPARLSVIANDARPVALFQNGDRSYVQIKNGAGAFPQTYNVGVEAVGGTFNINDAAANQTRLTINSSGNVGIGTILPSTRLEVNSGIANDSGFAFSQLNAASPALGTELKFLTVNALGKVILSGLDASVFATSSPAGVNGSVQFKKDGLFASNTNFNWDDINSRLGLGTNAPTQVLDVAGNIKVRTDDKIILDNNQSSWITNGATRDMTRAGTSMQFWTASNVHMQINDYGDFAWNGNGSGDRTFEIRPSNGQTSNVLVMKQNPNQGANTLFAVNGLGGGYFAGNVGIGTNTPTQKVDVVGNINISQNSAYMYAGVPVITAIPSLANYFFANSGNLTMTGRDNTAIGNRALQSNTIARDNTALGAESLRSNTTGQANTGLGQDSLRSNITGSSNTGVGVEALLWNVSGDRNSVLGLAALKDNISGSDNVILGYLSGQGITTGSANTIIGSNVIGLSSNLSNNIIIADGSGNRRINVDALGNVGLGTLTPARKLHVAITTPGPVARFQNADGTCNINPSIFLAFNCLSDRSLKKDIAPLQSSLALFAQLNPVNYHWNTEDSSSPLQYGFIAQDIEAIFPSFVTTDSETGIKSVAFGNLIPVTIKAVNEMNVHLGDLSKDTTSGVFAESTIFKRFTDAFKALTIAFKNITADKATVKELCLPKSDGTVICLTGDQVAVIVESAGVASTETAAPVITPAPVVPPTTPVVELPFVINPSESPVNGTPEVVTPVVEIAPPVIEQVTPTPIVEVPVV